MMMKFKSLFWVIFLLFLRKSSQENLPCILSFSTESAFCIESNQCSLLSEITEFINPDKFEELQQRFASCLKAGPKMVCCESKYGISTSTLSPRQEIPSSLNEDLTSHKNYKLFDQINCGKAASAVRISNGEDAGLLSHPWAVRLGYRDPSDGFISYNCGGTLITSYYVLTAAHCVKLERSKLVLYSVRLGDYDVRTNPDCDADDEELCADAVQDIIIQSSIAHEKYNKGIRFVNDIGLIRLRRPANLKQNNIKTICLPFNASAKRISPKYEVIGWGQTTNSTSYPILQRAFLPEYDFSECQTKFSKYNVELVDSQLCAGGEEKIDSCKGDSGSSLQSPAILNKAPQIVQYGLVSFGISSCGEQVGMPGIYTKISSYLKWIMDNMKEK